MGDGTEHRIPVLEERAHVEKQLAERGVVKISTSISAKEQVITEALWHEEVDIRRVPVNQQVDTMPGVRQEGDVTVIPVVEERAVVVKHWVLVEELRVQRRAVQEIVRVPVTVHSTEVSVERRNSPQGEQT